MAFRYHFSRTLLFALLCAVSSLMTGASHADDPKPESHVADGKSVRFRGRTIENWVAELRTGPVRELETTGEEAISVWIAAARDPKAVTWVLHALSTTFREETWVGPIYLAMLDHPKSMYRVFALMHLGSKPKACSKIAPGVVEKAREWARAGDKDLVEKAFRVLNCLDPPPASSSDLVREMWPVIKDDFSMRWEALDLLGRVGPEAVDSVMEIYLKHNANPNELHHFTNHARDPKTIAAVILVTQDKDPARRRVSTLLLSKLARERGSTTHRTELVETIEQLLDDEDIYVQRYALDGMKALAGDPAAIDCVSAVAKLLASQDSKSRHSAADVLAEFGAPALPQIREAAESQNPEVRVAVCSALSQFKSFPKEDVGVLLKLAKDEHPHVRRYAIYALGQSHLDDPRVVATVVKGMDDSETKDCSARALAALGPLADDAVEALEIKLQTEDLRKRLQTATALWAINQDVELLLPIVQAIVKDDHGITTGGYYANYVMVDGKRIEKHSPYREPLSARAAKLLGEMGPAAKPAVGDLAKLLKHANPRARSSAISALGKIGPAAAEAVPELKEFIRQNRYSSYLDILKKIDPAAAEEFVR